MKFGLRLIASILLLAPIGLVAGGDGECPKDMICIPDCSRGPC